MEENEKFESQMTLYCITIKSGTLYFEKKEALDQYLKQHNISIAFKTKVEYMGNILNSIDVIRQTYEDGTYRYISVASEEGYLCYSFEQSKNENKPIWGFIPGSLRDMYDAFKKHGIVLEDDTYQKIDNAYRNKVKHRIKRQMI